MTTEEKQEYLNNIPEHLRHWFYVTGLNEPRKCSCRNKSKENWVPNPQLNLKQPPTKPSTELVEKEYTDSQWLIITPHLMNELGCSSIEFRVDSNRNLVTYFVTPNDNYIEEETQYLNDLDTYKEAEIWLLKYKISELERKETL